MIQQYGMFLETGWSNCKNFKLKILKNLDVIEKKSDFIFAITITKLSSTLPFQPGNKNQCNLSNKVIEKIIKLLKKTRILQTFRHCLQDLSLLSFDFLLK